VRKYEVERLILEPHFYAVRDTFASYVPAESASPLCVLKKTEFVVDAAVRNSDRHYAACRDDGKLIVLAPQAVDELDLDTLVAILAHEFGHAADFAYPGDWMLLRAGEEQQHVVWVGEVTDARADRWRSSLWKSRGRDEIERTADAIAEAVTGRRIMYCGGCTLQCFQGPDVRHRRRPEGLR
jgi:hypothetical protein